MGEGEGKKDVTDQIEDEEQLLGLKGDEPDKDQAEEAKELGQSGIQRSVASSLLLHLYLPVCACTARWVWSSAVRLVAHFQVLSRLSKDRRGFLRVIC